MREVTVISHNEAVTLALGRFIGEVLAPGDVLALWGELGAGKTLLTRGIARGLSIPSDIPITSPTFTFINEYDGRLHLYHLDLYRLSDPEEIETLPWREALFGEGAAVIEWPERMGDLLPPERFDVRIAVTGDESRIMILEAHGDRNQKRLAALHSRLTEAGM